MTLMNKETKNNLDLYDRLSRKLSQTDTLTAKEYQQLAYVTGQLLKDKHFGKPGVLCSRIEDYSDFYPRRKRKCPLCGELSGHEFGCGLMKPDTKLTKMIEEL